MPFTNKKGSINMTCVFLKKGDCSGYDMRLEWKSLLESTHSSNFSLRL